MSEKEFHICSLCVNRELCYSDNEFRYLEFMREKLTNKSLLYFKENSYIFKPGDEAKVIFCVYSGKAEVSSEKIARTAVDGDVLGFNSIREGRFINSAKALEDTFCCTWELNDLNQLMEKYPLIAEKIKNSI